MTILTYYDDNYKNLADLVLPYLEKYCKKHNYKLVKRSENYLNENRPKSWAKIKAIQEEFEKTNDWIFWIDIDAIIINDQIKIEDIVDEKFDIIFSTDGYYAKPWNYWPSCACFFIRKTDKTVELLNKIWNQPEEVINHCWWENFALLKAINENPHLRSCYKVIDYKKIFSQEEHWKQNDFIMHLGGGLKNSNEKYIKMKNFIDKKILQSKNV